MPGVVVTNPGQAQFGIVQGSVFADLRRESAEATTAIGFEGYAIGGLSVGEPPEVMYEMVGCTTPWLPDDRPRYLMGAGTPEDLVEAVARGVDLFDCVLPTRNARNGQLFTANGRINIKNLRYAEDSRPAGSGLRMLHVPHRAHGPIFAISFWRTRRGAATLNTLHNLHFYLDTLSRIRDAIAFGRFENFRLAFHQRLSRQSDDP